MDRFVPEFLRPGNLRERFLPPGNWGERFMRPINEGGRFLRERLPRPGLWRPRLWRPRLWRPRVWCPKFALEDWGNYNIGNMFQTFLSVMKWSLEIFLLALFWLIVLPPFMHSEYLVDEYQGGIIRQIITVCAKPSIQDLVTHIISIVVLNLTFCLILRFRRPTCRGYHIVSAVIGYFVLQFNCYPRNMILILGFMMIIFLLIRRVKVLVENEVQIIRPIYIVSLILIVILCLGEIFFPNPRNWQECRGIMMIMAMKTISLAIDDFQIRRVTYVELLGYLLCPATVLFGPWLSMDTYRLYYVYYSKLNWKWVVKMVQIFTYAMVYMVLSNCLTRALIPTTNTLFIPCKWHEAFRNAFVFRASNYFICYMAEFTMITAGFNTYKHYDPQGRWQYPITRPSTIEFPRSIAVVVRNWNIPVHRFLKENVYIPFSDISRGYAIILTFLVSALLHGLNTRITVILLSLGLLSLSQQVIQEKLSEWLNCCCRINACRGECEHRFGFWHPITLFINGINMILNIAHLAYLGHIMDDNFDRSSLLDLYHTWDQDFGFLSHHIILIWFGTMLFML